MPSPSAVTRRNAANHPLRILYTQCRSRRNQVIDKPICLQSVHSVIPPGCVKTPIDIGRAFDKCSELILVFDKLVAPVHKKLDSPGRISQSAVSLPRTAKGEEGFV